MSVRAAVRRLVEAGRARTDDRGRVTASGGISLTQTPHRIETRHGSRWTNCAYDALGILGRTPIDWDYLVHRARLGPRRVLSLLFYATSKDLAVPESAIRELYRLAMSGDPSDGQEPGQEPLEGPNEGEEADGSEP